ncbi:serine/threonine-protein phosphatase 4 regulatory subunit [Pimephales promelas]|nr:serine/threonine-protein phosphatase 4 regulatory subunit [Pimephales promelas]
MESCPITGHSLFKIHYLENFRLCYGDAQHFMLITFISFCIKALCLVKCRSCFPHLQTAEEIDKLTVDEDLNDIERAVYLLSSGEDVQRASVIINLPFLVRQNPAETFRRVVPKVREVLHLAGADMQLAAAGSFLTVLQDDIVLIQTHTHSILQIVLLNLDHRDTVVSNAWLETLLSAIDALPKETIRQEILSPLLSKHQLSQSVPARLASCRILGKVVGKFESSIVKKDLLPLIRSLCQDVEYEVRACMCRQLENITRGIGLDHTKVEVLPELVELAQDEASTVRLAAFDTIINLLEMFDSDDRTCVIFPLVKAFCEKCFKGDEAVLASLSFQYGKLCHGLSESFTDEQHLWFLEFYKKLCCLGLQHENGHCESQAYPLELENKYALVRRNCAYNFPAIVLFADPNHFLSELYRTFSSLCHDPEISVRRTAAGGFHEVVKLLGPNVHYIHKELITLLQDDSLEVSPEKRFVCMCVGLLKKAFRCLWQLQSAQSFPRHIVLCKTYNFLHDSIFLRTFFSFRVFLY